MRKKVKGFTLIELMTVIFIITLLIAIMIPNLMRARQRAQLTSCESNLKSQATANTIYANDNNGHYAKYPGLLMPNYLKAKPTCASAGSYTYFYLVSQNPDSFTFFCHGGYHTSILGSSNFPQYDSINGLMEK
ncbi:MAG: competence type IV pilus major pilin ComGC [Candidatus Xenobiia bacterium LiM19]